MRSMKAHQHVVLKVELERQAQRIKTSVKQNKQTKAKKTEGEKKHCRGTL